MATADSEGSMAGLGELLRIERERRGLTLEDAERATKIRKRFLVAIEAEEFAALPADVYTRGFIRNYAQYLDLDPGPLLAQLPSQPRPARLEAPTHFQPPSSGWLGWLVVLLIVGALGGTALYFYDQTGLASVREAVSPPVVLQVPTVAPTPIPTPTPAPVAVPTQPRPAGAPGPSATATGPGVKVELRAVERTWIAAMVDGVPGYTGTLEIGDQRTFTGTKSVVMTIGNAGGLEVTFNGRRLEPLGRPGQVLRNVMWTVGGMQIATVTPEPPSSPATGGQPAPSGSPQATPASAP